MARGSALKGIFGAMLDKVLRKSSGSAGNAGRLSRTRPRPGSSLRSIDDVYANPQLLAGKSPAEVERMVQGAPGWRIETLGQGRHKGQGWVFRHCNEVGHPTGPHLRWHPGGGHHGPEPYWRVIGQNGRIGGEIR